MLNLSSFYLVNNLSLYYMETIEFMIYKIEAAKF